ncbi:MAG: ABC transporter ATP-binding protein, partial [Gammaproteobacteria bacterium]|nr:ABC transporter ATP-binding protein [Gammaproteobacteria bacterium]
MKEGTSLWAIARGQRTKYLGAIFAMALTNLLMFGAPLVGKYAIDVVHERDLGLGAPPLVLVTERLAGADAYLAYLVVSAIAGIALTAVGGFFLFLRGLWTAMASEAICRRLREELFRRLHHLRAEFFDGADTGDLVQRCSSDVETVRVFLSADVVEVGRASLLVLTVLPILFWLHADLAWLSICLLPFLAVGAYAFFSKIKHVFEDTDRSEGVMTA